MKKLLLVLILTACSCSGKHFSAMYSGYYQNRSEFIRTGTKTFIFSDKVYNIFLSDSLVRINDVKIPVIKVACESGECVYYSDSKPFVVKHDIEAGTLNIYRRFIEEGVYKLESKPAIILVNLKKIE